MSSGGVDHTDRGVLRSHVTGEKRQYDDDPRRTTRENRVTRRRFTTGCALVVLTLLAGCTGDDGDAADVAAADADESTTEDANANDDNGGGDEASVSSDGEESDHAGTDASDSQMNWEPMRFSQAGTYTYDFYFEEEGEGTVVFSVTDLTDEQVTVHVDYQVGETSFDTTVTGAHDTVYGQLMASPASAFVFMTLFSPMIGYYQGETLEVGNQWTHMTEDGMATFEITEVRSYAGVDCHASEMRVDGDLWHDGCFAADHGSIIQSVYYDEASGEVVGSIELTDYREE